jgi:hypothetical protein
MAQEVLAIAHDGRIDLYKNNPNWLRPLLVEVHCSKGLKRRHTFPAQQAVLPLEQLPDTGSCRIKVRSAKYPHRWLKSPQILEVIPAAHQLRGIITGSGRCGTHSISHYLDGMTFQDGTPVHACHETLTDYLLPVLEEGDVEAVRFIHTGFTHGIEAAPHLSLVADTLVAKKIVHLVRDGRRVVQSGLNRGWYQNNRPWNRIKPDLPGDVFEKCCRFWVYTNERAASVAGLRVRLEDLAASSAARDELLDYLEIQPSSREFPRTNRGKSPSSHTGWTSEQDDLFADICGELMDAYYPGWQ